MKNIEETINIRLERNAHSIAVVEFAPRLDAHAAAIGVAHIEGVTKADGLRRATHCRVVLGGIILCVRVGRMRVRVHCRR